MVWAGIIERWRQPKDAGGSAGSPRFLLMADADLTADGRRDRVESRLSTFKTAVVDGSESGNKGTFEEKRSRVNAAFAYSHPVADRHAFVGRREALDSLIRAIQDLRLHAVLYGGRGIGKTSVLHFLAQSARDAGYLVVNASCGNGSEFRDVLRSVANQIPLLYCRGIAPTSPAVEQGKTLADLLPEGTLSVQAVSDVLASIVAKRVIVVLDDFDQCSSKDFRLSVAELLKNLSDRAANCQFIIGGVAADLSELLEYVPSAQRNIYALQLSQISASEARELIAKSEAASGLQFTGVAANCIIHIAGGFPYFVNLLGNCASLQALDDGRTKVLPDDFVNGMREALAQLGAKLPYRAKTQIARCAKAEELQMLGVLAGIAQLSGGSIELAEIQKQFPNGNEAVECQKLLGSLSNDKALFSWNAEPAPGSYRFLDDTVIPYLWLAAAQARLKENTVAELAGKFGGSVDDAVRR